MYFESYILVLYPFTSSIWAKIEVKMGVWNTKSSILIPNLNLMCSVRATSTPICSGKWILFLVLGEHHRIFTVVTTWRGYTICKFLWRNSQIFTTENRKIVFPKFCKTLTKWAKIEFFCVFSCMVNLLCLNSIGIQKKCLDVCAGTFQRY